MDLTLGLYLIDVFQGLEGVLGITALISGLAVGFMFLCGAVAGLDHEYGIASDCLDILKTALKVFIPSLFLTVLIPSEKTMYLMAASEVAQYSLTEMSPEIEAVREIIREKLQDLNQGAE